MADVELNVGTVMPWLHAGGMFKRTIISKE